MAEMILLGPLAQRLEQGTHNPLVVGSIPTRPTNILLASFGSFLYRVSVSGVQRECRDAIFSFVGAGDDKVYFKKKATFSGCLEVHASYALTRHEIL